MKKFCIKIFTVLTVFVLSSMTVLAESADLYKFYFAEDSKTKKEIARTIVPDDFVVSTSVKWARDYENPLAMTILAQSKDRTVTFFFSSAKTYIDNYEVTPSSDSETDTIFMTEKKAFVFPQDFVTGMISRNNPQVKDITLVSSFECSADVKSYLMAEMYDKIDNLKADAKSDRRFSKVMLGNPYIQPFSSTYMFNIGNDAYKQTVIAMISSVDYEFTKKTGLGKFEKFPGRLWFVSDYYILKAKAVEYDEYYEKFIVFVANTIMNKKAENSLQLVKQQMKMELSPTFTDVHTGSNLRNLPSDLFNRYYEGGLPSYLEDKNSPMQKPSIEDVKWFSNIIHPQNRYKFVKIPTLWNQPVYVPQKYQYIYYDKVNNRFAICETEKAFDKNWIQLKLSNLFN